MDDQEKIASFCAITDSDVERAAQYLAVCDGDMDRAVNLFLESGGASLGGASTSGAASVTASTGTSDALNAGYDSDEDDAAMAARLQREEDARRQSQNEVRERIAPRTETLVEDYPSFMPPHHGGYSSRIGGASSSNWAGGNPGIFNQDPEIGIGASNDRLTEKQTRLAQLFRPPFDIMSRIDFDTAKERGRAEKRWLLVNVQDLSDFQCQVLNRDFWANEAVKETVRANFVFMQYAKDAYDGQNFMQYYPISKFPYIAILDPRTGEEMKRWEAEVPAPDEWVAAVHDFLDRFSLDPTARNPLGKMAKHKPFEQMSEEEQIDFALQQSMGRARDDDELSEVASEMSSVSGIESVEDHGPEVIDLDSDSGEPEAASSSAVVPMDEDNEDLTLEDVFASILPESRAEPAADPKTTTRLQFRLSDGTRVIRRFNNNDPVRYIFEFIKAEIPSMKDKYFQVISMDRKKLIESIDATIEEAGLKNAAVLIEAEED
ncbi:uncharacterized protein V1518DRAFT_424959 [Limtongia smithiae]|uniref:uncharacterized protein n=1 Tax=Limtongia smithiae TaxID=1125753 RepID=UPI0034CE9AF4